MARAAYVLNTITRKQIIAWALAVYKDNYQRTKHGPALEKIARKTFELQNLLFNLNFPGEFRNVKLTEAQCDDLKNSTMTEAAAWLEECLHRIGSIAAVPEWQSLIWQLNTAATRGAPRKQKPGTMVQLGPTGNPTGPTFNFPSGSKHDRRGRKELRPTLRRLVDHLLDISGGRLSLNKNTGRGSLVDTLKDLRSDLPKIIPVALPISTIYSMVQTWKKRPKPRTRKPHLLVVK